MNLDSRLLHLPHPSRYAVSAVAYLVSLRDEGYHMVAEIAAQTRLSASYLSKILQRLAKAGIIDSRRGAKGGYRLARPPASMALSEVISASRGPETQPTPCMLQAKNCDGAHPCAMHPFVASAEKALWNHLKGNTLESFHTPKENA